MEVIRNSEKGKFPGHKKYSTSFRDVKRKLLCINKRISELHHQRKSVYKNSVKVKKMVHNQINQIVKCFRARERVICSDVDEVYFSQDAKLNDELSRLQSIYAHCQALFNHIEDFKEKSDVLRNIDTILSEISPDEKTDAKPLEFLSDFEMMKVKANSYGYLEGDFVKNDFIYVDEEKGKLFDDNCKLFQNKEFLSQNSSVVKKDSNISIQKSPLCKISDSDDFQIIDLFDNMSCQDIDDFTMDEDVNLKYTNENKFSDLISSKKESTFEVKECNTLKNLSEVCETNIDFNPEEEWKQILEMNKIVANWHGMTSKKTESNSKEKEICNTTYNPCKFSLLKETNNWLYNSKHDKLERKETSDKISSEMNYAIPAKIIETSFKSYLVKDNIQNWLSNY